MATKKLSALIQIGGSVASSLGGSINKSTKELGKISDELKKIAKSQDKIKKYDSARSGMRSAIKDYEQARIRVEKLGNAFKETEKPTNAMRLEMNKAVQSMRKAAETMDRQKSKLHALRGELHAAGVDTRRLTNENEKLDKSFNKLGQRHARIKAANDRRAETSANLSDARGNLIDAGAIATAIALPVLGSIKADAEMERAVGSVAKVMEFGSAKERISALQGIRDNIEDVRATTGQTLEELGDLFSAAASDNQSLKQQKEFGLQAAKASVAWDMAAGEAGRSMMAWRSGMNLTMQQTYELGDAVNYLDNRMRNVRASELAEVLQRGGAGIKNTGVLNEYDAAAISASLLSSGSAPDVAATGQKHFIRPFVKSFATTKPGRKAWDMLGNLGMGSPENIAKEFSKDQAHARNVIFKTLSAINKLPKDKRGAVILRLFGDEALDPIQKLVGNVNLLADAFDLVDQKAKFAGKSINEEFGEVAGQKTNRWARISGKFGNLAGNVGKSVEPITDKVMGATEGALDWGNGFAKKHPRVTGAGTAGATAGGLGLLGWAGSKFLKAKGLDIGAKIGQYTSKSTIGQGLKTGASRFGGMALNGVKSMGGAALRGVASFGRAALPAIVRMAPLAIGLVSRLIGLIPGWGWAIAGVSLAVGLLVANWDKVGPAVTGAWDSAVKATMGAWQSIQPVLQNMGAALGNAFSFSGQPLENLAPVKANIDNTGRVIPMPTGKGGSTYNDNTRLSIVVHPGGSLDKAAVESLRQELRRQGEKKRRGALND
jgi:TP901 family phage tail tape measure protein